MRKMWRKFWAWLTGKAKEKIGDVVDGGGQDKPPAKTYEHGRIIVWYTPQGKRVRQHEDGFFADGQWEASAKLALPGAAQYFADKTGDTGIIGKQIMGSICKSTMTNRYNAHYEDNGEPCLAPEDTAWNIEIEGGYNITFDYGNSRDAIYSGNGVYWVNGGGKSVYLKANHNGTYKGMRTWIR